MSSDLFGAPPPPAPAKRRAAAAPAPARPQVPPAPAAPAQVMQADLAPAPRGHLVKLHDGREVDSWSAEWRDECLARWLLGMGVGDRERFLDHHDDAVHLRVLMQDIDAAERRYATFRRRR